MIQQSHRRVARWLSLALCSGLLVDVGAQSPTEAGSARSYRSLVGRVVAPVVVASTGPPPNLVVPSSRRALVQMMWDRSPTFRRQCDRIAATRPFVANVTIDARSEPSLRGLTTVRRRSGTMLEAHIALLDFGSIVEMLAHELEHVIEQLDGVDVERRAQHGAAEVTRNGLRFETTRATEMGQRVAREVASRNQE
jgi:hypothetical protein